MLFRSWSIVMTRSLARGPRTVLQPGPTDRPQVAGPLMTSSPSARWLRPARSAPISPLTHKLVDQSGAPGRDASDNRSDYGRCWRLQMTPPVLNCSRPDLVSVPRPSRSDNHIYHHHAVSLSLSFSLALSLSLSLSLPLSLSQIGRASCRERVSSPV